MKNVSRPSIEPGNLAKYSGIPHMLMGIAKNLLVNGSSNTRNEEMISS